ncbi:MAG: threonine--tRNA ligase [Mycoplasma sp.]|nr:threonine--tRNA ligase [Mycoplasma sp.]
MKVNKNMNHSAAHVLAAAVLKLFPNTKIGFGPAIDEGFYYDFEFENPISENDLPKIEKQMKKIISGGGKVEQVNEYDLENQPYKDELVDEIIKRGETPSYYGIIHPSSGKSLFTDLCAGGHIESISKIKHFKLLSLAGAYWRGDSNNKQLTRIYGTAWESKEELDQYLNLLKERKERDHRKIGKDMEIFMFNNLSGQGFPIWLPNGMIIKNEIQKFIREKEVKYGFNEIQTPSVGSVELYKISGHWQHYKDDNYPPIKSDNEELMLRPMTCPHHLLVYNRKRHSYKEFPIRYSEQARLFRYEKSGALTGLERVRAMELTEGHVFVREDQIAEEFKHLYSLINETLKVFNIKIDYVSLSLRDKNDKDKYFDDDKMWESAEAKLRNVLDEMKIEYVEVEGEAAFYGPKIDMQVKTVLGHEITMSTLQLDFLLPKRFDAKYLDKDENEQTPILIHRGLIGTYERFISILLEQTKGNLPFWIAPKQIVVIPVSLDNHTDYALEVFNKLKENNFRVKLDNRNERLGKKIRNAQTSKTKYQIVIGDNEVENKVVTIRKYGSEETETITLDEFIKRVK